MKTIILKIGGSCLTYKKEGIAKIRQPFLNDVSRAIYDLLKLKKINLIIVHGGGSITHPLLDKYQVAKKLKSGQIRTKKDQLAAAKIHWAMNDLNKKVVKKFLDDGIPAWPMQTSALFSAKDEKNKNLTLETIKIAMEKGYVPVLHGDLVLNHSRGSSICSGDYVATMLAEKTNADVILFASDVDGVFSADPNESRDVKIVKLIDAEDYEKYFQNKAVQRDHSGGMKSKIDSVKQNCKNIEAFIFNGLKKGNSKKAFLGHCVGTRIKFQ